MINATFEGAGFADALEALPARMRTRLREGMEATCESIASRARQTTTYRDRTGLLRQSTQAAGVEQSGDSIVGIVSFAARSKQGFPYGVVVNRTRRFIEDAIAQQDGRFLESALGAAFRDAGFKVEGG